MRVSRCRPLRQVHDRLRWPGTAAARRSSSALYAATWEFFGGFTSFAVMVGALLAVALRAWNTRHPDARPPCGLGRAGT